MAGERSHATGNFEGGQNQSNQETIPEHFDFELTSSNQSE
jgi:hypothetical protein